MKAERSREERSRNRFGDKSLGPKPKPKPWSYLRFDVFK